MAFRMAALVRSKKSGEYTARKGIPKDVREPYARLYGPSWEVLFKLPAGTSIHEARTRYAEWLAEVETRFAALRAAANGQGQPLTRTNAFALAGRWYTWFVGQHANDPRTPKYWREMDDHLAYNVLYPEAPDEFLENSKADPHWRWTKEPEVQEAVRPQIAERARVATFLASEGLALNVEAYALFVDAVSDNLQLAISILERRASGDYSRDDNPDTFPPFTDGSGRGSGVGCWELFEAFVTANKPAPKTVSRWRAVFLEMQREFAEVGADGITEDAARKWMHGLITEKRAAVTVREIWLSASRRVFGWAREHKRIRQNPFKEVKVDVPRKVQTREDGRSFTASEASKILKASLTYEKPTTPLRPWSIAFSESQRFGFATRLDG